MDYPSIPSPTGNRNTPQTYKIRQKSCKIVSGKRKFSVSQGVAILIRFHIQLFRALNPPKHSLLVLSLLATSLPVFSASPDFKEEIQPILELNCVRCHNEDKVKGGLRMDTYEKIMEGGDTADAIVRENPIKANSSSGFIYALSMRASCPTKGRC